MSLQESIKPVISAFEKMPQKTIAAIISCALLVYIAFILAKTTWLMFPNPSTSNQMPLPSKSTSAPESNSSINVAKIKALNLFGQFNAKPAKPQKVEVQEAPQTRLNLTLTGVVASNDQKFAAAIIESSGNQFTYGIGDKIEKTRATLEQVYADRVLIKQSGSLETLMLDGVKYNKVGTRQTQAKNQPQSRSHSTNKQTIDQRSNKQLAKQATALKQDLVKDPGKITDYLRISPHRKGNQLLGYRLSPGKKPEFFKSSGLRAGDIAVQMNGLDLTSPQEASQAIKTLRNESEISLLIDRNGELTDILFSIN